VLWKNRKKESCDRLKENYLSENYADDCGFLLLLLLTFFGGLRVEERDEMEKFSDEDFQPVAMQ
jgi:hypothetical protein